MNLPYNYLDLTIEMDPIFDDQTLTCSVEKDEAIRAKSGQQLIQKME